MDFYGMNDCTCFLVFNYSHHQTQQHTEPETQYHHADKE